MIWMRQVMISVQFLCHFSPPMNLGQTTTLIRAKGVAFANPP